MLIKFNKASVLGVGRPDGSPVTFKPGVNDIKKEDWDSIKSHPDVIIKLGSKELEVVGESPKVVGKAEETKEVETEVEAVDFKELTTKEATKVVEDTFDKELLEKWLGEETRKGVTKAINNQLEIIELPPEE